jgi:hypothetical protein
MKNKTGSEPAPSTETELDADRRKFLASCGKFAAVTPPALTLLLSTSLTSDAIAHSGRGGGGGGGWPGGRPGHRPDLPDWLERLLDWLF